MSHTEHVLESFTKLQISPNTPPSADHVLELFSKMQIGPSPSLDVDNVLELFTNLQIDPSTLVLNEQNTELLHLPPNIISLVFTNLHVADFLSLAMTCKYLYSWSGWAYHRLDFRIGHGCPKTLMRTIVALQQLTWTLEVRPVFRTYVRIIYLYDLYCASRQSPSAMSHRDLPDALDRYLSRMVMLSPGLRSVTVDATALGHVLTLPQTVDALFFLPYLREVALINVSSPSVRPRPAFSRSIRSVMIHSEAWDVFASVGFLLGQKQLQKLDLTHDLRQLDADTLAECVLSWAALQELSISCDENNVVDCFQLIAQCTETGAWHSLHSLSIQGAIRLDYLALLRSVPLRRLRIIVNVGGQYSPDYDPSIIGNILFCFPTLEELVLDHSGMSSYVPKLDRVHLATWAEHIRAAARLRVLVLPTLFVVDPTDDGIHDDLGDGDWAEDGESDDSDVEDVRMVPFVADKGKQPVRPVISGESQHKQYASAISPSFCATEVDAPPSRSLRSIDMQLNIWAEDFFDYYLQSTSLHELRFLHYDPQTGYRESVAFRPIAGMLSTFESGLRPGYLATRVCRTYEMFWEPGWTTRD
ncbi:hypothetical protein IEO21_09173 [Rhodonia placenta]|uniref:F-box domain-containing protein n=1 Tax=Rhodonia placenta TaxID=104341 RepID=A0A8H7NV01_9APHY|nr:hypothetical protein IEO21_09173 [Postia placenta]